MIGAIAGDVIGSVFEWRNVKTTEFPLFCDSSKFTDDTVMTVAVADHILNGIGYIDAFKSWGIKYPWSGYGLNFSRWLFSEDSKPYNSWGNGSAMRVSPVGFAFKSLEEVLEEARRSAEVTHNHPEGIKGAQATASAIFLARQGESKKRIKKYVEKNFAYNLRRTLSDIIPTYSFDESCQGSVPEAIIAFLESEDFEDTIRKAISIGGDSDTIACIAGGISQAYYRDIPSNILVGVKERLTPDLLLIVEQFNSKFGL